MVKADLAQLERPVIQNHALLRENIADGAVVTLVEPAERNGFDQPVGLHSDRERERTMFRGMAWSGIHAVQTFWLSMGK